MPKRKPSDLKSRRSTSPAVRAESDAVVNVGGQADAAWFSPAAIRETVESVIIAFANEPVSTDRGAK